MTGRFITFEGVEGCGKSTQIERVQQQLEASGHTVCATREPGGPPIAEAIRGILLDPENKAMSPVAELLLYEAARAQHVDERIRPALEQGQCVLCDRFTDSTTAYQGAGRALDMDTLLGLHKTATRGVWPELTIVIDVPAESGLQRAARRREKDRIEQEALAFHERVRDMFLAIAQEEPERVKVVDGTAPIATVTDAIMEHVNALLSKNPPL